MMTGSVSVILPAHNEADAIAADLDGILAAMDSSGREFEVIVVDDGSTDGTAEIVRGYERVKLLSHRRNRGTGSALKTGIRAAEGEIIMMSDADGTYPNDRMPELLEMMGEHDLVIGARRNEAGTMRWLRTPAKLFIRLLASYMTGRRIPDLNSGLRCFRKSVATQFFNILPDGHSFVSTITIAFMANNYSVAFLPIDYFPRKGQSHFRPLQDTYNYLLLVVRTIMYFDPLRVFLPLALVFLLVGGGKALVDVARYDWRVTTGTVLVFVTGAQLAGLGLLADLLARQRRPGYEGEPSQSAGGGPDENRLS